MEVMGIMGFMIGGAGMTFALIALGQVTNLKKELEELKNQLGDSGVIEAKSKTN